MSELVCIGTSDAFGAGGRRQSAYLLRLPGGAVLLDCGQTTLTGLDALAVERDEVDAIVVSHFHADHFGGIPLFLIGSLYADQRTRPLRIVGPRGIEARVREAARALGHPIDHQPFAYPLTFEELPGGGALDLGPARLRAFETHHAPDSHPHGVLVEGGGLQVAYSGDTGWFDGLPEHVNGSDLFLCECTQVKRGYEFHLSLDELAERRGDFDCGRIVLTHLGAAMREVEDARGFELADDARVVKL